MEHAPAHANTTLTSLFFCNHTLTCSGTRPTIGWRAAGVTLKPLLRGLSVASRAGQAASAGARSARPARVCVCVSVCIFFESRTPFIHQSQKSINRKTRKPHKQQRTPLRPHLFLVWVVTHDATVGLHKGGLHELLVGEGSGIWAADL